MKQRFYAHSAALGAQACIEPAVHRNRRVLDSVADGLLFPFRLLGAAWRIGVQTTFGLVHALFIGFCGLFGLGLIAMIAFALYRVVLYPVFHPEVLSASRSVVADVRRPAPVGLQHQRIHLAQGHGSSAEIGHQAP